MFYLGVSKSSKSQGIFFINVEKNETVLIHFICYHKNKGFLPFFLFGSLISQFETLQRSLKNVFSFVHLTIISLCYGIVNYCLLAGKLALRKPLSFNIVLRISAFSFGHIPEEKPFHHSSKLDCIYL